MAARRDESHDALNDWPDLQTAATMPPDEVLERLGSRLGGLAPDDPARRLAQVGLNELPTKKVHWWDILGRQFRSPMMILFLVILAVFIATGNHIDMTILLVVIVVSVIVGFYSEMRSQHAITALDDQLERRGMVWRDGQKVEVDDDTLVPGDIVDLGVGDVVPADLRLLSAEKLECDESALTGEADLEAKSADAIEASDSAVDLASCCFMGTVVREGLGRGVIVRTGPATQFGQIAGSLATKPEPSTWEKGLAKFSRMLAYVTGVMVVTVIVINLLRGQSLTTTITFAIAIAIGLTPELLPAIVSASLAVGAHQLAKAKVLVRRLMAIEDLGNMEVLFTDKTGTLTQGTLGFDEAIDMAPSGGTDAPAVLELGLVCNEARLQDGTAVGGNPLDRTLIDDALRRDPGAVTAAGEAWHRVASLPFDFERKLASVLADGPQGRLLITKGAPETLLDRCANVTPEANRQLDELFDAGLRVIAVGARLAPDEDSVSTTSERDLDLVGYLTFRDPPKEDAKESIRALRELGVHVKIVTGDNAKVAMHVCRDLELPVEGVLSSHEIDAMDDEELGAALPHTRIFARVTPEQKSRIIKVQRAQGTAVAFMGDGVNDAVALHDADVGISVDTATDVAREAADVILLEKDLGVLAQGVREGRRIFNNTGKYILMVTSSNFGNMFSMVGGTAILPFIPLTAMQILLNNLLYTSSQVAIPTDHVDPEQVLKPQHWDIAMIRRFMIVFGPLSSIFDFCTFAILILILHVGETGFHTGWFVESIATQTLVVFVIRTHRVPFLRSRPSKWLALASLLCVVVGVALPYTSLGPALGFEPLPLMFLGWVALLVVAYLVLVDIAKYFFFGRERRRLAEEAAARAPVVASRPRPQEDAEQGVA